ncbi:MAG: DUF892 family protein [Planctomycetota bacterium]
MMSLSHLLSDQIRLLLSAESQLARAVPKVVEGVSSTALRRELEDHLAETHEHVDRLERIAHENLIRVGGKACKAMEGLIGEVGEALAEAGDAAVCDVAVVATLQRLEQFEVSAYSTAVALARELGMEMALELLHMTLDEERRADLHLTEIRDEQLFARAPRRSDRPALQRPRSL